MQLLSKCWSYNDFNNYKKRKKLNLTTCELLAKIFKIYSDHKNIQTFIASHSQLLFSIITKKKKLFLEEVLMLVRNRANFLSLIVGSLK